MFWHGPCLQPIGMSSMNQLLKLGLCVICALTFSVARTVQGKQAATPPSGRAADRESVQGKVSAKTEASLTVDGKVITTTGATAFMKDGKPITISDVQVGDKVKVGATKVTDGSLQAVMVEVLNS